jgi:hypothetical protein
LFDVALKANFWIIVIYFLHSLQHYKPITWLMYIDQFWRFDGLMSYANCVCLMISDLYMYLFFRNFHIHLDAELFGLSCCHWHWSRCPRSSLWHQSSQIVDYIEIDMHRC